MATCLQPATRCPRGTTGFKCTRTDQYGRHTSTTCDARDYSSAPTFSVAGPATTSPTCGDRTLEYTELESEILMSSCGITDAEWTTELPVLYE
jgi:hypothetical protein